MGLNKLKVAKYLANVVVLTAYIFILTGGFFAIYEIVHGVDISFTKELLVKLITAIFIVANIVLLGLPAIDFLMSLFIGAYFKYKIRSYESKQ
ncbi:MAG: hypothetical protein QM504_17255 [Pseudomonadota bacterium]